MRRACAWASALVLAGALAGCGVYVEPEAGSAAGSAAADAEVAATQVEQDAADDADAEDTTTAASAIDVDGYYYDVESVVLYLDEYGELPSNYVTKNEARNAGWEGGSVQNYIEGAAIGGDKFGNYEGVLPQVASGSTYRECDIDTDGRSSRGPRRLIYTDDGDSSDGCAPYYYTDDHYETFTEVEVIDGEVVFDD